tara:strand:+ start:9727 stop:11361 length:1635 start_codon:yes stop_codon:yes gene_type:complete
MATFKIDLSYGNNHISIPISFGSDEKNIEVQFNPTLKNNNGEYIYQTISTQGQIADNVNGAYEGNLLTLDETKSYHVNCKKSHDKTFNGSSITEHSLTYTLTNGANFISFPYTEDKLVGQGDYSTSGVADINFIINKNLLKGSGHASACIDYIKTSGKGIGEARIIQYDGSGSSFPDNWSGNLLEFKAGEGYFIGCSGISDSSTPLSVNLWSNTADDYNYVPLSGVTPDDSDGNQVFASPYGENITLSTFTLLAFSNGHKTVDKNNNTLLTADSLEKISVESGMTTDYQLVFYPFDRIGLDSNNPLGFACSNVTTKVNSTSGVDTGTGSDSNPPNIYNIAESYASKEGVYSAIESGGFSPLDVMTNDIGGNYPDKLIRGYKQLPSFSSFPNLHNHRVWYRLYLSTWYAYLGGQYLVNEYWRYRAFHGKDSPLLDIDPVNFNYQGYKICPIVYNPSESDGERYRYCEYHPHPRDKINSDEAVTLPDYHDVFFDQDGNRKYSETFGFPYAPPSDKIIPYEFINKGTVELFSPNMDIFLLRGVLKIL